MSEYFFDDKDDPRDVTDTLEAESPGGRITDNAKENCPVPGPARRKSKKSGVKKCPII
jgi:hypothetical protein